MKIKLQIEDGYHAKEPFFLMNLFTHTFVKFKIIYASNNLVS